MKVNSRFWFLLELTVLCLAFYFLARTAIGQNYRIESVPVSWPDIPPSGGQNLCTDAASTWAQISKGVISVTCQIDAVVALPSPFSNYQCEGDWTGAINASGGNGMWPFYVHGAPCPPYKANLGRRGGWLQGGGQWAHEFGHNLGLNHTGAVNCYYNFFDPSPSGPCTFQGYAQGFDVMGTGSGLNAPHAAYLRVPPLVVPLARTSQTVDVTGAPVRIPRGDGQLDFWIELYNSIVYVNYTGYIPFAATDVMLAAQLPSTGYSFNDPYGGLSFTRGSGATVAIAVTTPLPTSTGVPTWTPTTTASPSPTAPASTSSPTPTLAPTPALACGSLSANQVCLSGRFKASATFGGSKATGVGLTGTDGGWYWFYQGSNPEIFIKALDGTAINGHWWIFIAGMTNQQVTIVVQDTVGGGSKTYVNPQNRTYVTVTDTLAFP